MPFIKGAIHTCEKYDLLFLHADFGKCLLRFRQPRTISNVILLYKNMNCKTLVFKDHSSPCFKTASFFVSSITSKQMGVLRKKYKRLINLQTTITIFKVTHLLSWCASRNLCLLSLVQYAASHLLRKRTVVRPSIIQKSVCSAFRSHQRFKGERRLTGERNKKINESDD